MSSRRLRNSDSKPDLMTAISRQGRLRFDALSYEYGIKQCKFLLRATVSEVGKY